LSKSAILDYQMSVANGVIKLFLNASVLFPMAAVAALVSTILDWTIIAPGLNLPRPAVAATYTLALFIAGDLSRYILHRLLHTVPMLWNFHQIHHSATALNPFTVYRVHPVESLLFGLRRTLSTGLVTGIFIWLFGTSLNGYDVLGVNAIGLAFNIFGSNLRHSHVWLSYGTTMERIFISPAQHQIHHSAQPEHLNKNYGTCLSLWDKLGNSWLEAGPQKKLQFGLGTTSKTPSFGLMGALWAPFAQIFKTR
jgi:sterol desaturase/sphingolipid hydroxylase (fatty acid hydroxylase superfamily)